nr:prepilin-type N-terminal cleavage/methylation domain-containing protein [Acinetobacter populi]
MIMAYRNISHDHRNKIKGFTLIEVMVVVIIIAIIAAIAFPSYLEYTRKAVAAQAEQEMQKIAEQLERHKSRNFTYRGFDPNYIYGQSDALTEVNVPIKSTGDKVKYKITIRDLDDTNRLLTDGNARGRGWAIQATVQNDPKNYNLLMTSEGLRCKNTSTISYTGCGSNSIAW